MRSEFNALVSIASVVSAGSGYQKTMDSASRHQRRPAFEAPFMRVVATVGVIGIGVAIAAIMTSQHSRGWLVGLVVSLESVLLAGFLWSSRRL